MRVEGINIPGIMLSNTWIIYPRIRDNLGKLRTIPNSYPIAGMRGWSKILSSEDESAAYQVVVSVTDSLADDGYGP